MCCRGIRNYLLVFLTLLLNSLVIVLFEVPPEYDKIYNNYLHNLFRQRNIFNANAVNANNDSYEVIINPQTPKWFSEYTVYILGAFHVILALWMLCEYFVKESKNLLFRVAFIQTFL